MKKDDDKKKGQSAQFAAMDVEKRNARNEHLYSDAHKARARDLQVEIDEAYFGAKVYTPNYRQKFIAIKVEKPGGHRFHASVAKLDKELMIQGISITKTIDNNIIYRLPDEV